MATYYEPDDRGGYRVTLPNGTRVPMMLSEEKLRQAGALPVRDQGPDQRTAELLPVTQQRPQEPPLPPKPEQKADFVRADSPQFQRMMQENEAAAVSAGAARPGVSTAPQSTGESADSAEATVLRPSTQPYQSLDDRAAARVAASRRYVAPRPAGYVPTSLTQVTEGAPSDERVAQIGGANEKLMAAYAQAEQASADVAREQARNAAFDADLKQQQAEQLRQERMRVDGEVRRRMAEVDARTKAVRDAPDIKTTLWDQAGPLGVVSGFLAVWLGGMARYMHGGGENLGVKALNDTMDRNIEAQRARLAKQGQELDNAKGALAEYTRLHGDPELGAKELKAAQIEAVMSMGDARAARAKSAEVAANWQIKRAELEALKAREMADIEGLQRGKVQAQFAYDPGRPGGVSQMGFDEARAAVIKEDEQQNKYMGAQGLDPKLYVPSANAYALRDEDRTAIVEGNVAAQDVRRQLGRMKDIVARQKSGMISRTEARQLFEQARAEAIGTTNKAKGFGAVDAGSMETLLSKIVPDYGVFEANPTAAYSQGQANLTAAQQEVYRQRGLRGGPAPANMVTPVGQPIGVEKRGAGEGRR